MKILARAILAATATFAASGLYAQTCTPSQGAYSGSDSNTTSNVDTCAATNQLAVACNGLSPIGTAPDAIWTLTVGPGASSGNITFTPSGTAWNPYLMVMSGACASGSTCIVDADNGGSGEAETGTIPAGAGTYYLMVTDESGTTTCGAGTLGFGTLPVTLQNFTVS